MRTRRTWPALATVAAAALAFACSDSTAPGTALPPPRAVAVQALGVGGVQVTWTQPEGAAVSGYRLQRRADLSGPFVTIADNIPRATAGDRVLYLDTDVEPGTYYGYRVMSLSNLGGHSPPSTVGGARTSSLPTVVVTTTTTAPNDAAIDPDGYIVVIRGADTLSGPVSTTGVQSFGPLRPGEYSVVLRGLAPNCRVQPGDSVAAVQLADTGARTDRDVTYAVACRDPNRGSITVVVDVRGDTSDPTGLRLSVIGAAADSTLPDTARAFSRTETIPPDQSSASFTYEDVRPGEYGVVLEEVDPVCTVDGSATRSIVVGALSSDTALFALFCQRPPPPEDTAGKPFVLQHAWVPVAAATGSVVRLVTTLDLTADPAQNVAGAQFGINYDQRLLRYDSATAGALDLVFPNGENPGLVNLAAVPSNGRGRSGVVVLDTLWFTVVGAAGSAATRTELAGSEYSITSADFVELKEQVRVREATLTVGGGGGPAPANQPPSADAGGPYNGVTNASVTLDGQSSTDPDGTIASYAWSFGDGATGTGATTTHAYATAGTYAVTLTVTDDAGATDTDSTIATVTAAGPVTPPGNTAPTAAFRVSTASNVATPTAESPVFFENESQDVDGEPLTYAWSFGDDSTSSAESPSHTYTTAGTFEVTLIATDARALADTVARTLTVAPPSSGRVLAWTSAFDPVATGDTIVTLRITFDLSTDIAETPGPEALERWRVDSLAWDPAVLRLVELEFGAGRAFMSDQSFVDRGVLTFGGETVAGNATGVVQIATLRFRIVGGSGSETSTRTVFGALVGQPSTGSYDYEPNTSVTEGEFPPR